ncbi:carboxypeptidase-like regulatory domain-containing protein [Ferruginibacter paludis]|uniref:TonB-dependent receptor n=1 Tax=Ferruginibacter paludis TaxID=1310417 RepID=UPI0025B5450D|nr:TonB-dependent receptor [Ferruginibacter paludis]MDN3656778.1 carboxypeptidase-like regulatory domain-containing protein [Ferruginibacter paludis]
MRIFFLKIIAELTSSLFSFSCFLLLFSVTAAAQPANGFLKGRVMDGSSGRYLSGVTIQQEKNAFNTMSTADGSYLLVVKKGKYTLICKSNGFQTKVITDCAVIAGTSTYLDITLFPLAKIEHPGIKKQAMKDSVPPGDAVAHSSFYKENIIASKKSLPRSGVLYDAVTEKNIGTGTDRNGVQLLKRLQGVIVQDYAGNNLQSITVAGMGDRYNQVLLNGMSLTSFDPIRKAYPLDLLPADAYSEVKVHTIADGTYSADFAGGTTEIKTRDLPDQSFFYMQAGGGFSDLSRRRDFLNDQKGKAQWLSLPGNIRDLPAAFPTPKSQASFNGKNVQEQVDLSRRLKNNLAAFNYGNTKPDAQLTIGFGKIIRLKQNKKIGILGYLSQSRRQLIEESVTQVLPDVTGNSFPFNATTELIASQSSDINYRYLSHLAGLLNATFLSGTAKISFKNYFGSEFSNTYTQRTQVHKADEDSLAHDAFNYSTTQRRFLVSQLTGEHVLSTNGKLKLNWLAGYQYLRQENPDERNLLVRHDAAYRDHYELAQTVKSAFNPTVLNPDLSDPNLTRNSRLWRNYTDNNFEGSISIQSAFNFLHLPQVITGGVDIKSTNRVFTSTLLQVSGNGSYRIDSLLAPERYYPGGLTITNYYTNFGGSYSNVYANNRANYSASGSFGAAYFHLENELTERLATDWSIRVESSSQLVSAAEYDYVTGFKNPRFNPLDKNTFVSYINVLPSLLVRYEIEKHLLLHAGYFKTLNRPMLQELTGYKYYDPVTFTVKTGNSILQSTEIANYDAGINWSSGNGITIGASGFYKRIDQPIEYILSSYTAGTVMMKPHNTAPATVQGIDASLKIQLNKATNAGWLQYLAVFANATWLKSKVDAGPVRLLSQPFPEHTLSGSPAYTYKAGIVLQKPHIPEVTILFNQTGGYISVLGSGKLASHDNGNEVAAIPDYRIKGKRQLDMQVSQKIWRSRMQVIAGVTNVLDNPYIMYQDLNGNKKFDAPLVLTAIGNNGGYYQSGTDNTIISIQSQRTVYLSLSYLFR